MPSTCPEAEEIGNKPPVGMVTNCSNRMLSTTPMVFWDSVYRDVAKDYPDIKTDGAFIDAITMWLVRTPHYFDVIVASNLFGDIITDLALLIIAGGHGFCLPGKNVNPEKIYPSCSSQSMALRPSYEGKDRHPVASVESVRMMLEQFGRG